MIKPRVLTKVDFFIFMDVAPGPSMHRESTHSAGLFHNPNISIIQLRVRLVQEGCRSTDTGMKISLELSVIIVPITKLITNVIWFYDLLIPTSVSLLSVSQGPALSISAIWTLKWVPKHIVSKSVSLFVFFKVQLTNI